MQLITLINDRFFLENRFTNYAFKNEQGSSPVQNGLESIQLMARISP
jgi:hypothetical protein